MASILRSSQICANDSFRAELTALNRGLRRDSSTYRVVETKGSRVTLACQKCGNTKTRRIRAADSGTCPCQKGKKIASAKRQSHSAFELRLKGRKITVVGRYVKMNAPVDLRCDVCGTEWSPIAANVLLRNSGCRNYGCDNHRMAKNSLAKYGVRHSSQRQEVRAKFRRTMKKRFGVEHPSQNRQLLEKALYSAYGYVEYKLGSRTVEVQGYEPQALDYILANKNVTPDDIVCGKGSSVPSIPYTHKGRDRVYHPDIFIPKFNRIVEVKSLYTFKSQRELNVVKARACQAAGYKFSLLVMNQDGTVCHV